MSAATAELTDAPAPKAAGKKKLIIIIVATVLLLVLGGGGAAVFMMKKKAAAEADSEDGAAETHAVAEPEHKEEKRKPPIFVPLDPFTVNLADREAERYAQVGVTLEIEDAKVGEDLKLYLPAIRNNILMLLAHKTAGELLTREGKLKLAREIRREAMQPLGFNLPDEDEEAASTGKKKKKKAPVVYPVKAVHFSNIIIQ
ncbi:flagellar basal body-associated FliL family protein [Aquabacterium sp.]|uniref:flagellar basal body-associated FliL family protein n=1 Tax=Aquabacterium sp. TaxID=1872578 RepID=UPI002C6EA7EB|nr:flagellar basal body-associated FliL family protein [Aquabacterium sp.]HSW05748.1 flagellar basal body-associated FliL family protein [Aquabacterium sp.]